MADNELFGNSEQLESSLCGHEKDHVCDSNKMVGDLVSRQAAISHVDDVPYIKEHPNVGLLWKAWIESLPPAQPERKGKWIYHSEIGWGDTWLCDQCGEKTTSTVMGKPRANYCPMCGADMRGESDG